MAIGSLIDVSTIPDTSSYDNFDKHVSEHFVTELVTFLSFIGLGNKTVISTSVLDVANLLKGSIF